MSQITDRAGCLALLATLFGVGLNSCSSSAPVGATQGDPGAAGQGAGRQADPAEQALVLEFETEDSVRLKPGESTVLGLRISPAGSYAVRFALLGEAQDASLDRSEAVTSPEGTAAVRLTAPSLASLFTLRASAGTSSTALEVAVSEVGFATLRLKPTYAGSRPVHGWVASVHPGDDCSEVPGGPFSDGSWLTSAGEDSVAEIRNVPVEEPMAITMRSAELVGGCIETGKLLAGTVMDIEVPVTDRPMRLEALELDLNIGVESESNAWTDAMRISIEPAVLSLRGSADDDVEAFVDALHEVAGVDRAEDFAAARVDNAWDESLREKLGADDAPTLLSDLVRQWMVAAADDIPGDETFRALLASGPDSSSSGELTLTQVAGLDPRLAGFNPTAEAQVSADPGDKLLFSTTLYWLPSQLLTEQAARLLDEQAPGTSPVQLLSDQLPCSDVAETLGPDVERTDPDCTVSCVEDLCRQALDVLWKRARNTSATLIHPALLRLNAITSVVDLDEQARPLGVRGAWLGTISVSETTVSLGGTITPTPTD